MRFLEIFQFAFNYQSAGLDPNYLLICKKLKDNTVQVEIN